MFILINFTYEVGRSENAFENFLFSLMKKIQQTVMESISVASKNLPTLYIFLSKSLIRDQDRFSR